MYAVTVNEKKTMLLESGKGYMGGFEGRKEKGEAF